jgi:hypothetical protein
VTHFWFGLSAWKSRFSKFAAVLAAFFAYFLPLSAKSMSPKEGQADFTAALLKEPTKPRP